MTEIRLQSLTGCGLPVALDLLHDVPRCLPCCCLQSSKAKALSWTLLHSLDRLWEACTGLYNSKEVFRYLTLHIRLQLCCRLGL